MKTFKHNLKKDNFCQVMSSRAKREIPARWKKTGFLGTSSVEMTGAEREFKKGRTGERNFQKGMTLLELTISSGIFSMIFLAMTSSLTMANVIFRSGEVYSRLNQSAMQSLRYISREIGQSSPNTSPNHFKITTDGDGNNVVTFQIPVDWDNDGDAVSGTLDPDVEWGIYDHAHENSNGRLNGWARYSVSNGQLMREILDASEAKVDGLSQVIANDVTAFSVTKSEDTVTMNLTLTAEDAAGQAGKKRDFQSTFSSDTILRNGSE